MSDARAHRSGGRDRARWAERGRAGELALLHCVSAYPTAPERRAALATIPSLRRALPRRRGRLLRSHARPRGAASPRPRSARASSRSTSRCATTSVGLPRPPALGRAARARRARAARGRARGDARRAAQRRVLEEEPVAAAARRSLVAGARPARRATRIAPADLTWLRPRDGLAPGRGGSAGRAAPGSRRRGERVDPPRGRPRMSGRADPLAGVDGRATTLGGP